VCKSVFSQRAPLRCGLFAAWCAKGAEGPSGEAGGAADGPAGAGTAAAPSAADDATPMDEDALLQQALAMSMAVHQDLAPQAEQVDTG
jgi:hypothetical protein